MSERVCIIDYGSGNVRSVYNIFKAIHGHVKVSNEAHDVEEATHLVLPGVGAFGAAVSKVRALPVFDVLCKNVLEKKKPFLGICVGMQMLADKGHEHGDHEGLGWIGGEVKRLEVDLHLPHVGWNNFKSFRPHPLLESLTTDLDFYFVHSYHFQAAQERDVLATCEYGMEFTSMVQRDNILGVQFHPEKSQKAGKRLLENFIKLS